MKIQAGRHAVELSNPNKNLFGETNVDKQELAEHYARVWRQ